MNKYGKISALTIALIALLSPSMASAHKVWGINHSNKCAMFYTSDNIIAMRAGMDRWRLISDKKRERVTALLFPTQNCYGVPIKEMTITSGSWWEDSHFIIESKRIVMKKP